MTAARVDGRHLRAARTRAAIVSALYQLVRDGEPAPTAAAIAHRAGVALRSIGQHFPSRDALLTAVAAHHAEIVGTPPRLPATGPRDARLRAFVRARAADLERGAPLRRALERMDAPPDAIRAGVTREQARRRAEVAHAFAVELAAHPRALDRLDVIASPAVWDALRARLAAPAAARELAALLRALLG